MLSRYPRRFEDDGTDVTLDVHGCTIEGALLIVRRTVAEAHRRGRGRVMIIHGKSGGAEDRTIKGALEQLLEQRQFEAWVSGSTQSVDGGQTTLWMTIGPARDPRRMQLRDLRL